ncbi:MAG TPA: RpiB/LacA/LacB family sugar-phosphate isomerase [Calditrichaeota bacterium]|nr:RpiB/LacA/LacB family sugar-phosphate isomerase [Calditrichota bacterium]
MKRLIREEDIRKAAGYIRRIFTDKNTIITPAARDLAKELGVQFEYNPKAVQASSPQKTNRQVLDEVFPVKVVAIASDHGGFAMKRELIPYLRKLGYITHDLGPDSDKACDYPDYALLLAERLAEGKVDRGIMIDSVGIGSAMAANKVKGVLAAKCNNAYEARSAREHNYANYLTFGAKMIGIEIARDIVKTFLETKGGAERHQKRVKKILNYDEKKH